VGETSVTGSTTTASVVLVVKLHPASEPLGSRWCPLPEDDIADEAHRKRGIAGELGVTDDRRLEHDAGLVRVRLVGAHGEGDRLDWELSELGVRAKTTLPKGGGKQRIQVVIGAQELSQE